MYLYLRALTRDGQLAEELTSVTFFKAMRAVGSFRGECEMRVWLCQIAKNCYYDHCRRQKKLVRQEEGEELCAGGQDDPGAQIERREDVMRIRRHLHDLKEPYKEVFMLRVYGEMGFKEIGALFGRSANWACVVFHRAQEKIRSKMEERE